MARALVAYSATLRIEHADVDVRALDFHADKPRQVSTHCRDAHYGGVGMMTVKSYALARAEEAVHTMGSHEQLLKRRSEMMTRRAALGGIFTALMSAGCGNRDTSTPSTSGTVDHPSVDPADFALLVMRPSTFVLNVHTPDEGDIPGTDAAIPYDQLQRRAGELPDRSTVVAVYCKTGRMSTDAVPTLRELGFTRVTELSGGMEAWQADGRRLLT